MINCFFAANYLGLNAFAAINLVFPLIMVFSAPGFGVLMWLFLPEILILIGASEELLPYALEFGRILFVFLPCMLTSTAFQIDGAAFATALTMTTFTIITLRYFLRPNSSGMHFKRFNFDIKKLIGVCYKGISERSDAISAFSDT